MADDSRLFREGLPLLLATEDTSRVVAEAGGGMEAINSLDVVVLGGTHAGTQR